MKTLLLASVLANSPALATESIPPSVIQETRSQVETIIPGRTLDNEGIQIIITLGSLLLGSALGAWADTEYRKRVPPEKRISARVLQLLREGQES